jgi:hypothetical protein
LQFAGIPPPKTATSGIGLISNAGARFEAPETISAQGRFENVHRGGYDPEQHLEDMALDGVASEVLYPSQTLFYFKVADPLLMSAIFRAYNDWLAEFCRTDPARLKGIAMINLDDVEDGIKELELAARLGLSGAMTPLKGAAAPTAAIRWLASNRLYSTVGEVAPTSNRTGSRPSDAKLPQVKPKAHARHENFHAL